MLELRYYAVLYLLSDLRPLLKEEYEVTEISVAGNCARKSVTNLCNYSFMIYEV